MPEFVKEALKEFYPEGKFKYDISLKYSGKFKPYNANVRLYKNSLIFNLSKEWVSISREIQIGLIQELAVKIFGLRKKTINMDLYSLFMKNVYLAVSKTNTDKILEESFDRVNESYFSGMLDKPNLKWGNKSTYKLGSYEYGSDTITISTIFKDARHELLDCIMHHEMLHKKFKFKNKNGRNLHHSPEFKEMEKKFENRDLIEKEVWRYVRKSKFGLREILRF